MNNNVVQAVSANGIGAVMLAVLLLNFYRKYRNRSAELKVFAAMLFANMSQCLVEGATFLVDGQRFPGDITLSVLLNAVLFANNLFYSFMWTVYAEMHSNGRINVRRMLVNAIPAMILMIGVVINLFTPVFFEITAENVYVRTSLFPVTYVVTYSYLLLGTVSAYRGRNRGERYIFLPVMAFLLPVVIASIVQYLFQGIALMWVGAAIGMNSAFISLVDESAAVDPLSGAFSRHQLNEKLHALPHQVSAEKRVAGLMMDIDDFKTINDNYGHLAGDEAIRIMGTILRRAAKGYGTVYRYAGDEFTIILPLVEGNELELVQTRIQEGLQAWNDMAEQPWRLSLSMGHTFCQRGEKSSDFIRRMDEAMYQQKKR